MLACFPTPKGSDNDCISAAPFVNDGSLLSSQPSSGSSPDNSVLATSNGKLSSLAYNQLMTRLGQGVGSSIPAHLMLPTPWLDDSLWS